MSDQQIDALPVCGECGAHVPAIERLVTQVNAINNDFISKQEENKELADSVVRTQRQLSQARGTITSLREQQTKSDDDVLEQAMEIAEYWKKLLAPRTRELKGPRIDKTVARLRAGYPIEELKQAVYGYYCRQYVVDGKRKHDGKPGERWVDLELIMRDAKHVDTGISIAVQDAKLDVELIHRGGSRQQALLCDCGHPAADHLRPDLAVELGLYEAPTAANGNSTNIVREPCAHKDCPCYTFDTIQRAVADKIEEIKTAPKPPASPFEKAA